jgi:cytochrome c biogenesis protein CcmG/thiol:disulfide interchange protein DsbE
MTESDRTVPIASTDPDSGADPLPPAPTLADDDTDPDREAQGRIGYGRWGKWSPIGLGLLILLAVAAIWYVDHSKDDNVDGPPSSTTTGELKEPRPAPDFEVALLNGEGTVSLDELKGKTVVLNFWASWCNPCREEMPALQESWEAHQGDDVVFVGVGAKNDKQKEAEAFAEEFGITYPIGRDTEGGDNLSGATEMAYGVRLYPATFFITPDGMINQIVFGPLQTDDLETYIANASD